MNRGDLLASGWSIPDILSDYPGLEEADILACIAYGAEMAHEAIHDVSTVPEHV